MNTLKGGRITTVILLLLLTIVINNAIDWYLLMYAPQLTKSRLYQILDSDIVQARQISDQLINKHLCSNLSKANPEPYSHYSGIQDQEGPAPVLSTSIGQCTRFMTKRGSINYILYIQTMLQSLMVSYRSRHSVIQCGQDSRVIVCHTQSIDGLGSNLAIGTSTDTLSSIGIQFQLLPIESCKAGLVFIRESSSTRLTACLICAPPFEKFILIYLIMVILSLIRSLTISLEVGLSHHP